MNDNVCFNCAFCMEHFMSPIITCDKDEHEIENIYSETCEHFEESKED